MEKKRNSRGTFVSLFSGCGGLDLGFVQQGFRCVGAFDSDPRAVETYKKNLGSHIRLADISEHSFHQQVPNSDILVAGPPCQGFSTLGKRNPDDPRNSLITRVGEIVTLKRPRIVVIENVPGVLAGTHRRYWEGLKSSLLNNGYRISELRCDASKFGIAQLRRRVILIGWRTPYENVLALNESRTVTLYDVLQEVSNLPNHDVIFPNPKSEIARVAKFIGQGQKLCDVRGGHRAVHSWSIPSIFGAISEKEHRVLNALMTLRRRLRLRELGDADPLLASQVSQEVGFATKTILDGLVTKGYVKRRDEYRFDLSRTFNGKYKRLSWNELSYTVDTRFVHPRYFLHPSEDRGFTAREAARIQGFPDDFLFTGNLTEQIRQIGNAVPPPLAVAVAECVARLLR